MPNNIENIFIYLLTYILFRKMLIQIIYSFQIYFNSLVIRIIHVFWIKSLMIFKYFVPNVFFIFLVYIIYWFNLDKIKTLYTPSYLDIILYHYSLVLLSLSYTDFLYIYTMVPNKVYFRTFISVLSFAWKSLPFILCLSFLISLWFLLKFIFFISLSFLIFQYKIGNPVPASPSLSFLSLLRTLGIVI